MADIPQSRTEEILYATINGEEYTGLPESRIEELLLELKEVIEAGGGGGGGTSTIAWKPTVAADGTISWVRTASETKPEDQNIKGPDGDPGLGIKLVSINQQGHLIITYDDDTTQDAGAIPGGGGAVDPPVINLEGIASENDVNTKSATFTAANKATYLLIEAIAGDTFPVITSSSVTVNGDNVNLKEYYSDSAHINSKYAILDLEAGDVVAASVRSSTEAYGTSVSIMFVRLSSPIQNLVLKDSDARTSGECAVDFNADKDGFYLLFFFDRREGSGVDFSTIKLNEETITKNRIICQVSEGWEVRQGMCIASAKALDNFKVSIQARNYADAVGIFYVETGSDAISYSDLTDKPQINGVELNGNKTASQLGLVNAESGKGLSTNDYTTAEKTKLTSIAAGANEKHKKLYTLTANTWQASQSDHGVYMYRLTISDPYFDINEPVNIYFADGHDSYDDPYFNNAKYKVYKNIYNGEYGGSVEDYPSQLVLYYYDVENLTAPSTTINIYVEGIVKEWGV